MDVNSSYDDERTSSMESAMRSRLGKLDKKGQNPGGQPIKGHTYENNIPTNRA